MDVLIVIGDTPSVENGKVTLPVTIICSDNTIPVVRTDLSGTLVATGAVLNTAIINRAKAILAGNGVTLGPTDNIALVGGVVAKATG